MLSLSSSTKRACIGGILVLLMGATAFSHQSESASLTNTSVTLSTPRLSFFGEVGSGNTVGSSILGIDTTPTTGTSVSTAGIQNNDTIVINGNSYTVQNVSDADTLELGSGIVSGDETAGDTIYSPQSADLSVRFTTANAVNAGSFRVLIPAAASNNNDDNPDAGFWDFTSAGATVTCPSDVGSTYVFGTAAASAGAVTINSQLYHSFTCPYTGTGATSSSFAANPMVINGLINPAPTATHTEGTADSHKIIVQNLDNSSSVIDSTTVSVGTIESVRITASVDPQLTFTITGVASSASRCGVATTVATTPTAVPFGPLSLASFAQAAQNLAVSTNAAGGFVVTAIEDDQMSKDGDGCTNATPTSAGDPNCIQDAFEDVGGISQTTSAEWGSDTTKKGFGYSLHDVSATTTEAFSYNESSRTFSTKHFADAQNSETPVQIFSGTTVADNQNLDVCYRIIPAVTTQAGEYENNVTYRATATF
ncbi:MAG: hypothetical protein H6774_02210 [Pseudomonadales bacterium]|nr:hypothetical protein [Pseudomonadales bacterium]